MNITYLIGNGFDIGLGLNTRYSDFIPYLRGELKSILSVSRPGVTEQDQKVAGWILKAIETNEKEFWSDAEIAFGGMPFSDLANQTDRTIADAVKYTHDLFLGSMQRWLNKEGSRIPTNRFTVDSVQMQLLVSLFTGWIHGRGDNQVRDYIKNLEQGESKVDFVTFNYTKSLEKLLINLAGKSFRLQYLDHKFDVLSGEVCHVHGVCSAQGQARQLVFGIDNDAQIADETAKKDGEVIARLLKNEYQGYMGAGELDRARQLIENADIVVLFGLSFGATDRYWWSFLADYLSYSNKKLVICPYITDRQKIIEAEDLIHYKFEMVAKVFGSLESSRINLIRRGNMMSKILIPRPGMIETMNGMNECCDFLKLSWIGEQIGLR